MNIMMRFAIVLLMTMAVKNTNSAPSVIIVGGGPAGIAAAATLLKHNIHNITLLEAEGRIGGRIHSVEFGGAVVDLGAQWCHGEKNNVVYELVKDLDLLEPTNWVSSFYHSSQQRIGENLVDDLHKLFFDLYTDVETEEEVSLGDYMINRYNKTVLKMYENDLQKQKFAWEVFDAMKKEAMSLEGVFSWFDVAAMSDFEICEGNQQLHWKGRGYKTALDVLMQKYPNYGNELPLLDKTHLNKEVVKITWDDSAHNFNRVIVECLDGSAYTGDHVIITTSLGVLKQRYATLFYPSLPQEKANAIEDLGIAAIAKVFLHFPEKWWPDTAADSFNLLWSEKDQSRLLEEFPNGPTRNGQSWLTNLNVFIPVCNSNVLMILFCGEFIPEIEVLSEDVIVDGVMFVLTKFLGHAYNITKADSVLRSNWYTNPHFQGTYSYQTLRSRETEVSGAVLLSKPLISSSGKPVVLFAGEATNPIHYSTVHGAIETGFREANRIINL